MLAIVVIFVLPKIKRKKEEGRKEEGERKEGRDREGEKKRVRASFPTMISEQKFTALFS